MSALYALGKRDMTRAELEDKLRRHVARKLSDVARRAERRAGSSRNGSLSGAKAAGGRPRKSAREGDEALAAIVARIERLGLPRPDALAGREDAIVLDPGRERSAVSGARRATGPDQNQGQSQDLDPVVPDAEIIDAWISEVMEKMLGSGFVDDVRTATGMVRRALSRGEGMTRIRGKLLSAGLAADDLGAGVASGSAEFLLAANGMQGDLGNAPSLDDAAGAYDCGDPGAAESVREAERRACMAFMRRKGMGPWRAAPKESAPVEETHDEAVLEKAALDGVTGRSAPVRKGFGGGRPRESAPVAARRRDMAALIRRGFGFDLARDLMALDLEEAEAEAEAARDPAAW